MIISPDSMLYNEHGEYVWTPARVKEAWERAWFIYRQHLESGEILDVVALCGIPGAGKSTAAKVIDNPQRIVFDATFINAWRRARLFDGHTIPVKAAWIRTPHSIARKRNEERSFDRRVPQAHFERMLADFEPPMTTEGFLEVYYVNQDGLALCYPGGGQIHLNDI